MDPNSPVGTPRDYWVWLAPDWSDYQEGDKAPAGKTGWTRVKIRETLRNDGRIVRNVLDANGAPLAASGSAAGGTEQPRELDPTPQYDPDQKKRFDTAQTTTQRQTDQSERRKVSVTFEGEGADRKRRTVYESGPDLVEDAPETASTSPTAQRTAREEAEIAANAALPADQDPRAETNAERAKRADARIKEQGAAAKAAEDKDRQARIDEQNAATNAANTRRAEAQEARAAAAATKSDNKSELITGGDGKKYTRVTTVSSDGKTVTVKNYGPDGKEVGEIPGEEKGQYAPEPDNAPPMTYTTGQLTSGLRAYSSFLDGEVRKWQQTAGKEGIEPQRATKLMDRRIALAESALKEQEGLGNAQKGLLDNATTQRGQSLTETQSRRGTAERLQTNALSTFVPLASKLGPGGGKLLSDAINNTLAGGRSYVDSFGGLRESPEINPDSFPALAQLRQSAMAGIQTAAQGGPQIFDPRNPPAAPGAPAAPPVTGTPVPAATNPISNTPVLLPPTRPSTPPPPPVAPPANAQAAANAGPVPGQDPNVWTPPPANAQAAANAGPVPGQDPNTWTTIVGAPAPGGLLKPGAQPFTPDPNEGAPGGAVLPPNQMPVNVPYPDNAGAVSQMPSRFMQEQRYGQGNYFDPVQRSDELSQRLGIPPEIMKQALGGLYG